MSEKEEGISGRLFIAVGARGRLVSGEFGGGRQIGERERGGDGFWRNKPRPNRRGKRLRGRRWRLVGRQGEARRWLEEGEGPDRWAPLLVTPRRSGTTDPWPRAVLAEHARERER